MSDTVDKSIDVPGDKEWSRLRHDSRLTHDAVQNRIKTHCDEFKNGVGYYTDSEGLVCALFKFESGTVKMSTRQLASDGDHSQAVREVQNVKNSISGI